MKTTFLTLTINPSLDKSAQFDGLQPDKKIRCSSPVYDAGGGGINVSKGLMRLGAESICLFTSGGSAGTLLEELVRKENIDAHSIKVEGWTRENFIGVDEKTGAQYRFGFPGAAVSLDELQKIEQAIRQFQPQYFVASGSLNEGVPVDFYAKLAHHAKAIDAKFVIDASGESLQLALEAGVYLAKPNIGELAKLIGVSTLETDEADDAAREIIAKGQAEILAVSLGAQGAVLVTKNETHFVPAPKIHQKSTVGAGDSMVAGMLWALSKGMDSKQVIRYGVACGTAATMNEGTRLFDKAQVEKLLLWLQKY